VDNTKVRIGQIQRLEELKSKRNPEGVKEALEALRNCAASGKGNLLELAVDAARQRASLGEISLAMEKEFGRYEATTRSISGVYGATIKMDKNFNKAQELSNQFAAHFGRRPRIMIAKLGQDGHDRGAKIIATGFADMGFDVDIGPMFQTPAEAARMAAEHDVHILGISSLAAGHKTLVPETLDELSKIGREDILLVVGGVIPPKDYDFLFEKGVAGVFGPGTILSEAAIALLEILMND
jgi:methylmalonyl-CoA mutase